MVDSSRILSKPALAFTISVAALMLDGARPARAEVKIAQDKGWVVTFDGRINSFLSVARGAAIPQNEQNYTGLDDEATPDGQLQSARVRTGFIASVFGVELNNQLNDDLALKARVGMWILASSQRSEGDEPAMDAREAFFKIEGPWGGFLAGRAMSLFSRGAIMLDYDLEHNYGLGHPCATKVVSGGACGHSGFGVLFPGFHAGLVYNTPSIGGFQISAGLYDPAQLTEGAYRRTPLPRAEAEATLNPSKHFRAFVGTMWQELSRNDMGMDAMGNTTNVSQDVNAAGVNYGLMISAGPLSVGGSGYYGQGLGFYTPLEDNPINILPSGALRKQQGYYGAAAINVNDTRIAAGVGVSELIHDASDVVNMPSTTPGAPPVLGNVITPKQQVGFSLGFYQGVSKSVYLALEYFRAITTWYDRGDPDPTDPTKTDIIRPRQAVNFFNAGATVVW